MVVLRCHCKLLELNISPSRCCYCQLRVWMYHSTYEDLCAGFLYLMKPRSTAGKLVPMLKCMVWYFVLNYIRSGFFLNLVVVMFVLDLSILLALLHTNKLCNKSEQVFKQGDAYGEGPSDHWCVLKDVEVVQ